MSFERAKEFDKWWGRNGNIFESEALAIEELMPDLTEDAIAIGNGTGQFALRLGIPFGVDPSKPMCRLARKKGIDAMEATAENLPFADDQFSLTLLAGVISYVDDLGRTFQEAHRILKPGGYIVVAFLQKGIGFAKLYERAVEEGEYPEESPEFPYPIEFAEGAEWHSAEEVFDLLHRHGFTSLKIRQTLTVKPKYANDVIEPPKPGYERGSWIVVRGVKGSLK